MKNQSQMMKGFERILFSKNLPPQKGQPCSKAKITGALSSVRGTLPDGNGECTRTVTNYDNGEEDPGSGTGSSLCRSRRTRSLAFNIRRQNSPYTGSAIISSVMGDCGMGFPAAARSRASCNALAKSKSTRPRPFRLCSRTLTRFLNCCDMLHRPQEVERRKEKVKTLRSEKTFHCICNRNAMASR